MATIQYGVSRFANPTWYGMKSRQAGPWSDSWGRRAASPPARSLGPGHWRSSQAGHWGWCLPGSHWLQRLSPDGICSGGNTSLESGNFIICIVSQFLPVSTFEFLNSQVVPSHSLTPNAIKCAIGKKTRLLPKIKIRKLPYPGPQPNPQPLTCPSVLIQYQTSLPLSPFHQFCLREGLDTRLYSVLC